MGDMIVEPPLSSALNRHKLTVEDLYRMVAAGVLREEDRVELIDGELIDMAPIGPLHQGTVDLLTRLFARGIAANIVRVQGPIVIAPRTQLQPDLSILKERKDFYRRTPARPEDCLLVIEVADSTVKIDREEKIPRYGKAGVPESWLLDLETKALFIFTGPGASGYRRMVRPEHSERVSPALLPEISVQVAELFEG